MVVKLEPDSLCVEAKSPLHPFPKVGREDFSSARKLALFAISDIFLKKMPLDVAFHPENLVDERDRGFAKVLVMTILRRIGQLDGIINHCLDRPLPSKPAILRQLLRLGAVQLAFLETADHAAVDSTVTLAREIALPPPFISLVNAIMRRLAREGKTLLEQGNKNGINLPDWIWQSWVNCYGQNVAEKIASSLCQEPPLDLFLRDRDVHIDGGILLPTGTVRLIKGGIIQAINGFAEGKWWVQDVAASLPVRLLGNVAGQRIADLCAAPGGKTAQLLVAGALVTAVDRSASRLKRLRENLVRLSLSADIVTADAVNWRPAQKFDGILLDAPCSATGILRRHPDVAWLKTREDVVKLAALQERLLDASIEMLNPGGLLIYCTCSLQPEECEGQIEKFFSRGANFVREPISPDEIGGISEWVTSAGDLRTLPCHLQDIGGVDGFYATRLRKRG